MGNTDNETTLWESRVCLTAALGRWWCYWQIRRGVCFPLPPNAFLFQICIPMFKSRAGNQSVFNFVFAVQRQTPLDGRAETLGNLQPLPFPLLGLLLCSSAYQEKVNCYPFFPLFLSLLLLVLVFVCLFVCCLLGQGLLLLLGLGGLGFRASFALEWCQLCLSSLLLFVCLFVCEHSVGLWSIICLVYCCNTEYFLYSCPSPAEIEESSSSQSHTPLPCPLLE